MKRGNHSKSRSSKALVMILAVILVVGTTIGGTLAWFTDKTDPVVNTFTVAELFADPSTQFTLWEHEAVDANTDGCYELTAVEVQGNTYDILPGVNIPKDPTVDIVELEENAYLYIKVDDKLADGLGYEIDPANWEKLPGFENIIWVYKGAYAENNVVQASDDSKTSFTVTILKDNQITVPSNYNSKTESTLTFNAYMAQATGNGDDAAEAWTNTFGNS